MRAQNIGGPDSFGYYWKNNNYSVNPPTFRWFDITSIGTQVNGLADDNYIGPFYITGSFRYYWYNISKFWIGSNGYVSFDEGNIASPFPSSVPHSSGLNNWLAPLLTDLTFSGTNNPAECYYYSNADTICISFINVPFWYIQAPGYTGSNTFQVILSKLDSSITFNYLSTDLGSNSNIDNAVGIENNTGTLGLQTFVDVLPPDSLCVRYYYPDVITYPIPKMNGTYTIGNFGDYLTFNEAVDDLKQRGVSGAVVFNVSSGTYTEQVRITEITGASATNTITFQSNSGDSSTVTLQYQSPTSSPNYTFFLDGADYIRLKNMTFKALDSTWAKVIAFENGATNNVISNNVIQSFPMIDYMGNRMCIVISDLYGGSQLNSHNQISNNIIQYGQYGILFYQDIKQQTLSKGNIYSNNIFKDFGERGIFISYVDSVQITGNEFSSNSTLFTSRIGISGSYFTGGYLISKNKFQLATGNGNTGIWLSRCFNTASTRGEISNNFFSIYGTTNNFSVGLRMESSSYINIYHNSINIYGTTTKFLCYLYKVRHRIGI